MGHIGKGGIREAQEKTKFVNCPRIPVLDHDIYAPAEECMIDRDKVIKY